MWVMAEQVNLEEVRQVVRGAGFHDPNLSREDVLQIYAAIKDSETTVLLEKSLVEEVVRERSFNDCSTSKVKDHEDVEGDIKEDSLNDCSRDKMEKPQVSPPKEIKKFSEKRKVHWKYIPLRFTERYLNASYESKVQILFEDFENQRKQRALDRQSLPLAPLPPPIDLLAIGTYDIRRNNCKHILPQKRRKSMEDFWDVDKNDENRLPSVVTSSELENFTDPWLSPKLEDHVIEEFEFENSEEYKFSPKRKKGNETEEPVETNKSVEDLILSPYGISDSHYQNRKRDKTVSKESAVVGNVKTKEKQIGKNQWEIDLSEKDLFGTKFITKREKNKAKPLTDSNKQQNSNIEVLSDVIVHRSNDSTVKKKNPSRTPQKRRCIRGNSPPISKRLNMSGREARERFISRINSNDSLNAITIDNQSDNEIQENSSFNSSEGRMSRSEVDNTMDISKESRFYSKRSPQPSYSRSDMLFDNLKKQSVTKERDQAKLDKFTESLDNVTVIDDHSDDEEGASEDWLSKTKAVLNRRGVSTFVTKKVKKPPIQIYKDEPSTSKAQTTDCPFCGKYFSLYVIQNHVSVCERSGTSD